MERQICTICPPLAITIVASCLVSHSNLYAVTPAFIDAEGPIHDIAWGPNSSEFIVVYGSRCLPPF